eukprot:1762695-Pyramimonas_sp.AAC.1
MSRITSHKFRCTWLTADPSPTPLSRSHSAWYDVMLPGPAATLSRNSLTLLTPASGKFGWSVSRISATASDNRRLLMPASS